MTFYSQLNAAWRSLFMGSTKRTISQDGCTITCLSMVSGKTPAEVNRLLSNKNGYVYVTENGVKYALVSWTAACNILGLKFIYRYKTYDNAVALDAIKKYGFVLAEVDYDGSPKTTGKHWIVLLGDKKMNDPLSLAKHPELTSKYKLYTGLSVISK